MVRNLRFSRQMVAAFGVAIVCSLAISAASASATTQNWYSCISGGSKSYSDSGCTNYVGIEKGAYDWWKFSKQKDFSTKGTTPFVLKWSISGAGLTTTCTTQTATGYKIWDEEKTGGRISNGTFNLSGCTTKTGGSGKTCSTTISTIQTKGAPTEVAGKPALRFESPVVGGNFFTISMGAACGWGEAAFIVEPGSYLTGISNSATSSLEFTAGSSSLIIAKHSNTLEGTSKMGTSATEPGAGEPLKLAP